MEMSRLTISSVKGPLALAILLAATLLAACGGGGTDGTGGSPSTSAGTATGPVKILGSDLVVCGITFTPVAGATVRVDDAASTLGGLSDGMMLKIRGTIDSNHLTGTAGTIEAEDEIEGPVVAVVAADGMLTILGHSVFLDDLTVFVNTSGLAGASPIVQDDVVEVHGLRDSKGAVRASRVERKAPGQERIDVKGTVAGFNNPPGTFKVGATVVTFDPAVAPAGLGDGVPVEVEGTPTGPAAMTASAIEREDLEDAGFEPGEGERVEGEGYVSGLSSGGFFINGRKVDTTGETDFLNGAQDDLADDVRVQADGRFLDGKRVGDRVAFVRPRLAMLTTAGVVDPAGRTVTLFLSTVNVNANTVLSVPLSDIEEGVDRLEFRGYEDAAGRLIAERLTLGGGNDDLIQGIVEEETDSTFDILGITIGTTPAGGGATIFRDEDGDIVSFASFFAALLPASTNPPGSIVKASGTFGGGIIPFSSAEAELVD